MYVVTFSQIIIDVYMSVSVSGVFVFVPVHHSLKKIDGNKSLLEYFPEEKSKSFLKSNRRENEDCIRPNSS